MSDEHEQREVRRLLDRYRELTNRPRGLNEPRKGSAEALLRHVGVISKEDGEELLRMIMQERVNSCPQVDCYACRENIARFGLKSKVVEA